MPTAEFADRRAKDHEMIQHQNQWPQWPLLPIKLWKGDLRTGILFYRSVKGAGIELMFADNTNLYAGNLQELLQQATPTTPDQILDAGWTVD
jgi:hypothetical protein